MSLTGTLAEAAAVVVVVVVALAGGFVMGVLYWLVLRDVDYRDRDWGDRD